MAGEDDQGLKVTARQVGLVTCQMGVGGGIGLTPGADDTE